MRKIIVVSIFLLTISVWLSVGEAKGGGGGGMGRAGGGGRPAVGNRSAGFGHANVNRGDFNRADIGRSDVNRGNINNANINRNIDAHGWDNHYRFDGNNWGWGSFAGGAAAGAALGAAAGYDNVAVAAPEVGTVVPTLPAGCSAAAGAALYSCGGANYQPSFDGSDVVYQVVK